MNFWQDRMTLPQEDPGDVDYSCSGVEISDPYDEFTGGPIVMATDADPDPSHEIIPVRHDLDSETSTCLKCKKTVHQIAEDPSAECLRQVDYSGITRGMV